jgi:hypothetical protein
VEASPNLAEFSDPHGFEGCVFAPRLMAAIEQMAAKRVGALAVLSETNGSNPMGIVFRTGLSLASGPDGEILQADLRARDHDIPGNHGLARTYSQGLHHQQLPEMIDLCDADSGMGLIEVSSSEA